MARATTLPIEVWPFAEDAPEVEARAAQTKARVTVPGGALAQAIRTPAGQVRLARLLPLPTTDVVALDRRDATAIVLSWQQVAPQTSSRPTLCCAPGALARPS